MFFLLRIKLSRRCIIARKRYRLRCYSNPALLISDIINDLAFLDLYLVVNHDRSRFQWFNRKQKSRHTAKRRNSKVKQSKRISQARDMIHTEINNRPDRNTLSKA